MRMIEEKQKERPTLLFQWHGIKHKRTFPHLPISVSNIDGKTLRKEIYFFLIKVDKLGKKKFLE